MNGASSQQLAANWRDPFSGDAARLEAAIGRHLLVAVLQTAGDAIVSIDADQRIVLFNHQAEQIFGYSAAEIMGRPLDTLLPVAARAVHREHMKFFHRNDKPRRMMGERGEILGLRKDGSTFPAEASISKLAIPGGVTLMTAVVREISERKRYQNDLKALLDQFQALNAQFVLALESIDHGLAFYDSEHRLVVWNSRLEEMFRLSPGALQKGMAWRQVLHIIGELNFSAANRIAMIEERLKIARLDGRHVLRLPLADERIIEVTQRPTPDGGRVQTMIDVTERERYERQLEAARDDAEAGNRAKSEFLANMSHELRTPLNAIIGFSQLIAAETFGPVGNKRYHEYVGDILSSGEHLLALINDVLDMSRIEVGEFRLCEEIIEIPSILDCCVTLLRPQAMSKKIALRADIDPALPSFFGDDRRIKQVVINLLSNAIKFTPEQGSVEVSATATDDKGIVIVVADTGIGIAASDLERVMQPFIQIDTSLHRNQEGTGLGLPISKRIVELHGGTLNLRSVLGEGTRATILLPPERIVPAVRTAVLQSAAGF